VSIPDCWRAKCISLVDVGQMSVMSLCTCICMRVVNNAMDLELCAVKCVVLILVSSDIEDVCRLQIGTASWAVLN
jgi:hypothetical protein